MSDDLSPDVKNEIADAIFAHRKIEAIKLYREASGQGLKEAKEFVEALTTELREQSPEKFSAGSASGCGSAVFFLICGTGVVSWWFV